MSLTPGMRFGPYEILSTLGAVAWASWRWHTVDNSAANSTGETTLSAASAGTAPLGVHTLGRGRAARPLTGGRQVNSASGPSPR